MQPEAQWPYPGVDPIAPTMASAQSGTTTSLSDTALTQPAGFWVGARLRAHNWFVSETGTVTSSDVGSLTAADLPSCVSLSPNQQTNYSLSGKLALLAHAGSWFYDQAAGDLYLWTPSGASPDDVTVEAKQRSIAVDLSDRSYTSVQDLDIRAATIVTSATSSHNVLDRLNAQYVSAGADLAPDPNMVTTPDGCAVLTAGETTTGIQLNGTANELKNSLVNWSSGNGVVVSGTGNTVTNNTITNADYLGSYAAGINLLGADHQITHNTVFRTGRSSINIDNKVAGTTASGMTIAHNDLSNYNNLVVDGGAVYLCCKVDLASTIIRNNHFHDPAPHSLSAPSPGVYLDNGAFNATVVNNVAWNRTTYGVTLINPDGGPTSGNTVLNNTSGTDTNVASTFGGVFSTTQLKNNIGIVGSGAGITTSNNLVPVSSAQFTNPAAYDFTLKSTSPARNAGIPVPGVTDGYTDANPSIGAYQYGATKWTAGATRTGSKIQAESYSSSSGVSTHAAATGTVVGSFDGGDWIGYTGVDFGSGRDLFTANIGVEDNYAGQTIEIRLDSATGPVIGTLHVAGTGGFDTVSAQSAAIARTAGTHDVFLVAAGTAPGFGNIDDFTFSTTR
ncbi:carbohydrate-binding protein [Plantibacter sp. Mn2098]|uniref:carbohydrate-binding protein n=1 Tax=Plantibacter sp. Mn2098 TaxID=3395266 RepID=UPI003BE5F1C7